MSTLYLQRAREYERSKILLEIFVYSYICESSTTFGLSLIELGCKFTTV